MNIIPAIINNTTGLYKNKPFIGENQTPWTLGISQWLKPSS